MPGSVVSGEQVERVRLVFLGGQAVLASGLEAGMAHEFGDQNQVGSSANQSCGEGVPRRRSGYVASWESGRRRAAQDVRAPRRGAGAC